MRAKSEYCVIRNRKKRQNRGFGLYFETVKRYQRGKTEGMTLRESGKWRVESGFADTARREQYERSELSYDRRESLPCGIRNAECGMRNAECGMRNAECGMRNAE